MSQLALFESPRPVTSKASTGALLERCRALWPEASPWWTEGRMLFGRGVCVERSPMVFAGRSAKRCWALNDERLGLDSAILEARSRSMSLVEVLQERTGWCWYPARDDTAEHAAVHVARHTFLQAERRDDGLVVVELSHPAAHTAEARFPTLRGYGSRVDLRLERWLRLVDRHQPGGAEVVEDLDHARLVARANGRVA